MTIANAKSQGEEVSDAIRQEVRRRLRIIEQERGLRVLYACESGSRAWGFASDDSDYDVRLIYVRPAGDYLKLRPPVDAFDEQIVDDYDFGGWDIRKTAELMRKSNPPLLEWLDSPFVYESDAEVFDRLRELRTLYFDAKKTVYHYLSMARNVWKSHLEGVPHPVRKKYLYALRPLACVSYVQQHGEVPPTRFVNVLQQIEWPAEVMESVATLVDDKRNSREMSTAPADDVLHRHIEQSIEQGDAIAEALRPNDQSTDELDRLIHDVILK